MNTELLFEALSAIYPVSDQYKEAIGEGAQIFSFPRKHLLVNPPQPPEFAFFLNSGVAMSYDFYEGKKQVVAFWNPGSFIFTGRSFISKKPSETFVELLTPAEVVCFSNDFVLQLFDKFPEANQLYRSIMSNRCDALLEEVKARQRLSPSKRYLLMRERHPGIEQLVPAEQIATFLGITPQSFSRLKRRVFWN